MTSIGTKAFNGSKKLTKVTIGANIKKISNNAFFKCKSLKMVNIKSVLLTKKTANKKAFKEQIKDGYQGAKESEESLCEDV